MITDFSKTNSIFNQFLSEIRDAKIQKDRMRFRRNLERVAEIMAYEISKTLKYSEKEITTPLGEAMMNTIDDEIVLATILRAGIPMHQGLLNYFDKADSAFVSAFRNHTSDEEFDIEVEYCASPTLDGKILVISDPMLATGNSLASVYKVLQKYGNPKQVHLVFGIATEQGLNLLEKKLPKSTKIWVGAIDDEMTAQSYIVPGLGDAGDLAFGEKV
ncbi:uracil phosphoribosyltransferase [Brumimicrobium aurantiacum]|uniref:Uracil phosphoribosyltransferase n=1 Tax=Brumimicrobium aurantiacum TaxID=1737063 RepID=A0A3E1EW35_9FLAO|nr:uracil phosphoribosyltransferase [Brumimicrobium aurantiacum]RFC53732.1 uracil phosphoribosyltransferase [Brumimicrobium aurantiacum]